MPKHKKQSKQAKKAKKEARYKRKKRARESVVCSSYFFENILTEQNVRAMMSGRVRERASDIEFEKNRRPIIALCPVRREEQSGETFDLYINQKTKKYYTLTQPFARFIDDGLGIRNPLFKQCNFDLQVEHQRLKEFGVDEFCFYHKEKIKFQLPF